MTRSDFTACAMPALIVALLAAPVAFAQDAAHRTTAAAPAGQAGRFTARCAARDLDAVTLIEQRGEARDVPGARLHEASLAVLEARRTCAAGSEEKGANPLRPRHAPPGIRRGRVRRARGAAGDRSGPARPPAPVTACALCHRCRAGPAP